jgi:hypothetical protein
MDKNAHLNTMVTKHLLFHREQQQQQQQQQQQRTQNFNFTYVLYYKL